MIVGLIALKSFLAIFLRQFANQTFYHKIEHNFDFFFKRTMVLREFYVDSF